MVILKPFVDLCLTNWKLFIPIPKCFRDRFVEILLSRQFSQIIVHLAFTKGQLTQCVLIIVVTNNCPNTHLVIDH